MEIDIDLTYKNVCEKIKEVEKNIAKTRYALDESILKNIIPKHKEDYLKSDLEYVYFVSTLINSFYSTRMGNDRLYIVAEYISQYRNIRKLDQIIKIINEKNINKFQLKNVDKEIKKPKSFKAYSFLSKYYAIHNRMLKHNGDYSEFPIFDGRVEKCLKQIIHNVKENKNTNYSKKFVDKMKVFYIKDIYNYEKLYNMLNLIVEEINITKPQKAIPLNLTNIDRYFWSFK